jgi:hypothetical protein
MWVWVEQYQLNPYKLKKKILRYKDSDGYNTSHHAVSKGCLEVLE